MKQKFARFMFGRYGMDELSKFLTYVTFILLAVSLFLGASAKTAVFTLAVLTMALSYFRIFSKNIEKRRTENAKYLSRKHRITEWFGLRRDMWKQRREYRFFKCPSCRAMLRVPKGKGKIRVVCKKCGTAFEKKT
ncbi:MAG: hypothetical protein GXY01_07675 [Clostridiales bacterium]|nr:hypothetical protein [Clostridiales bacterium]